MNHSIFCLKIIGIGLLCIGLSACVDQSSDDGAEDPGQEDSGQLQLIYLDGMSQRTDGAGASTPVSRGTVPRGTMTLDLGDLKGSRDFYFLLSNTGDKDITDLKLSSTNPLFEVTPQSIDLLPPVADISVAPVVRVSAIHGVALEGMGTVDLMPTGKNTGVIEITGQSTDDDDKPVDLSETLDLSVNSQVMDAQVQCDGNSIDYGNSDNMAGTGITGTGDAPGYNCFGELQILNSGTVPMTINIYEWGEEDAGPLESHEVPVGETLAFTHAELSHSVVVELDGDNTVCDITRHSVGTNGNVFFVVLGP